MRPIPPPCGGGQMMDGFVLYNLPNQSNNQASILSTARPAPPPRPSSSPA